MSEVVEQAVEAVLSDGGNAIRIGLPRGVPITGALAEAAAARFGELVSAGPRAVIMTVTGVASITREARAVLAGVAGISALAVLGESPVDRVIANFVLGAGPLPYPSGFFSSESRALAWLEDVCAG
ncbi:STAS/SEC14 domain-containing protein [Arthrobacter sp. GCM10027362]|uniref:DUF7793 family protein n=1 Tax=Arthrobacter sp. GCM10027362 TaxID=3273379 RepID=UPI003635ABA3